MRAHAAPLVVLALLSGCAAAPSSESAASPLTIAGDGADHDCQVVLRSAERVRAEGGYETICPEGSPCWFVWNVDVDVSDEALASGAAPELLYRSGSDAFRAIAPAGPSEPGAPDGYQRFRFRMYEGTASPGMSITSLMRVRIELIPYLAATDGRLFDHNRVTDDLASYVLDSSNTWSVEDDPAVCPGRVAPAESTLEFTGGYEQHQHGAIVAGGTLRVEYDPSRLPDCRAHYTFAPVWSLDGFVRFLPSGETVSGSLVEATNDMGRRVDPVLPVPLEVEVPEGTTAVELWFHNYHGLGSPCSTWDSRYGANYRFDVVPARTEPQVGWAGRWASSIGRGFCTRSEDVPDPLVVDSWILTRAECADLTADVWIPGLTDAGTSPHLVLAQAEYSVDGGPPTREWLAFEGRFGNDYRYRWAIPRARMVAEPGWSSYDVTFRFSTDGVRWTTLGPRSLVPGD